MWTDDSKHYFTEWLNNALMQSGIGQTIQFTILYSGKHAHQSKQLIQLLNILLCKVKNCKYKSLFSISCVCGSCTLLYVLILIYGFLLCVISTYYFFWRISYKYLSTDIQKGRCWLEHNEFHNKRGRKDLVILYKKHLCSRYSSYGMLQLQTAEFKWLLKVF